MPYVALCKKILLVNLFCRNLERKIYVGQGETSEKKKENFKDKKIFT